MCQNSRAKIIATNCRQLSLMAFCVMPTRPVSGNRPWLPQMGTALNRRRAPSSNDFGMKIKIAALILIGSMMLVRADQLIESVQQALKNEGFYYGEVSGEMNANLTAAIRRYQIRNG